MGCVRATAVLLVLSWLIALNGKSPWMDKNAWCFMAGTSDAHGGHLALLSTVLKIRRTEFRRVRAPTTQNDSPPLLQQACFSWRLVSPLWLLCCMQSDSSALGGLTLRHRWGHTHRDAGVSSLLRVLNGGRVMSASVVVQAPYY